MNVMKSALALVPVAALAAACASGDPAAKVGIESQATAPEGKVPSVAELGATAGARILPVHRVSRPAAAPKALAPVNAAPAGAKLTYYGGPVLANAKVVTLFWSSDVQFQKELNTFYSDVTQSEYFDWLNEYNTPKQSIGRGSLGGSVVDPSPPSKTTLDDTDIQAEIARLIDAKTLPAPDGDTLYAVHFPAGISISLQGQGSCQVFCAYHSTFTHGGKNVYYSVTPDQGGSCAGGCGTAPNLLDNVTSVASHELVEATTDCAVGLAQGSTPAAPIAWYDATNGEIGDICNANQGSVTVNGRTHTVQKEWSNAQGACVTNSPGGGGGGTTGGGTTGGGTTGGTSGGTTGGGTTGGTTGGTCTPTCPTNGTCGGSDGCGGTCGCANGGICFIGICL